MHCDDVFIYRVFFKDLHSVFKRNLILFFIGLTRVKTFIVHWFKNKKVVLLFYFTKTVKFEYHHFIKLIFLKTLIVQLSNSFSFAVSI